MKLKPYLAVTAILACPLYAQDLLDPLIVTATRGETLQKDAPYSSEIFTAKDFEENTARTLPEALKYIPGVLVQKTAHGHGSPYIRGFTGRHNLLMVDGVRMNNSVYRSGPVQYWNTLDEYSLDRFELVRSQGSVLYGSDAVGGTLNAFTKSADFASEAEGEVFSHGAASYEYRTNGRGSHLGRLEAQTGIGGLFGLHLGLSAKEFGDIKGPKVGLMRGTGYPEYALDARADWAVTPQGTLTFVHQNVRQDNVARWHSTANNPGWVHGSHVAAPGDPNFKVREFDQRRSLSYLRYAHLNDAQDSFIKRVTGTVSYQTTRESEFQDRGVADHRFQKYELDTFGFDLEFESEIAEGSLTYGFDWYRDSVDSFGWRDNGAGQVSKPNYRPVANDSDYDLLGVYAQYIRPIGDQWELTAGLRYTYARAKLGDFYRSAADPNSSARESWDDLSASLRASYRIDDEWLAYAGISQAFRAPNLNDLSGNLTARSGITSLGQLGVDPEEFITYEIGIRKEAVDHGFAVSTYYTKISDVVAGVKLPPVPGEPDVSVTTNGSDGYIYGIEAEGYWNFAPEWTLSGFAAWQKGYTKTAVFMGGPIDRQYSSRLMPLNGSVALRWHHSTVPVWVEGRVTAFAKADRLTAGDIGDNQRIPSGGTPAYYTAALRAGYEPTENVQLTAALENLTDRDYRHHGSGQNEPGINAIFGVKYHW